MRGCTETIYSELSDIFEIRIFQNKSFIQFSHTFCILFPNMKFIFFLFSGKTVIWLARWPTTTLQLWLRRHSQVDLYFQQQQKWNFLSLFYSNLCVCHKRIQLFQKVRPLHNSWSNENLQCKCQYMVKGWFSKIWQFWKLRQCASWEKKKMKSLSWWS